MSLPLTVQFSIVQPQYDQVVSWAHEWEETHVEERLPLLNSSITARESAYHPVH